MEAGPKQQFPWITLIAGVVIVTVAGFGFAAFQGGKGSVDKALGLGERALTAGERIVHELPRLAEQFKQGQITETFRASLPWMRGSGGDILELATAQSDEFIRHEDTTRIAWEWISLGTTVAEIRARVTFRYHLRLSDTWELQTRSNVCVVLAPAIRPSLPPAIHTDTLEKRAESGWARFDKNEQLEALERSMTAVLSERAADSLHLEAVRASCRKAVADYVRNWLLDEDHWREDRFISIIVHFPDEIGIGKGQALLTPDRLPVVRLE